MVFVFQVKPSSMASSLQAQLAKMDSIANAPPPREYIDAVSDRKKYLALDANRLFGLVFSSGNLARANAFICGERHTTEWQRDYFTASMKKLKALGFTTIGLEFVCSDSQALLDRKKYHELAGIFKTHWMWDAPLTGKSVMGIIRQAHKCGMRVVALDLPPEVQKNALGWSDADVAAKDAHMAGLILKEKGDGKVLVLCGAAHNKGIAERLSSGGMQPLSLIFIGGDSLKPAPLQAASQPSIISAGLFEKAIRLSGRDQELFAIPKSNILPFAKEKHYPDYIIHMPETEPMPAFMKIVVKQSNPLLLTPRKK